MYKSLPAEINKSQNKTKLTNFIEAVCNPISYVNKDRSKYDDFLNKLNRVLIMVGANVNEEGKLIPAVKEKTLEEVDKRVSNLKSEFERRKFHFEIMKYCKREYLSEDYFHALQETVKGILQSIRNLTGYTEDGNTLVNKTFDIVSPKLVFNTLLSNNEKNEYLGLRKIIEGLVKMIRKVSAHKPRILHNEDLDSTLELFAMISYVHKCLDICAITNF